MAKAYKALNDKLTEFIKRQHMFFTASAAQTSRVNISPRSTECLRVIDTNTVVYLDRTGSGNETAAHLRADGRMTILFCAMEGAPHILRLYGRGTILHRESDAYAEILKTWYGNEAPLGARQVVRLDFDLAKTSCGFGVPVFEYVEDRDTLQKWAENKGEAGVADYWRQENQESMDGLPTGIFDPS